MTARSKLYRLEGIVLARRDHGEADRVVVMLTPEMRVDLLAKGIRKPRSRKAGHLEMFSQVQVLISRVQGSWDIISQADAVKVRQYLLSDFERGTYARYIAELVLRFFEGETEMPLYNLVSDTLDRLDAGDEPARLARWYETQLLELAGFRPEWGTCVGERKGQLCFSPLHPRPEDERTYGVDPERGGALCPDCFIVGSGNAEVRALSPGALSWLQALQRHPYAELASLPLSPARANELARVLEYYIAYHLERRPSVLRMLK
ncbi:MAG: DNA repair protein RecO [Anaerolineae bacterium]|nr:DNA repair protein RecO [Anaerolineae bacterium]